MAKSDNLLRELERLEGQIEAFEDHLREAESYPEQERALGRMRRAVSLFLLRRDVTRQVYQLQLRRNAVLNCLRYAEERGEVKETVGPLR